MKEADVRKLIKNAGQISQTITNNIDTLNGDDLSKLSVRLSGYYNSICGFHESIKSNYIERWNKIRPLKKSDKACDMWLMENCPSAKLYDGLKYTLKGLDKLLKSIDTRLYELHTQARNQT